MKKQVLLLFILIAVTRILVAQPEHFTSEEKPWLWWYWMGSAVSEKGIDDHLDKFERMGYGGASIAATYGVDGFENKAITFMSREWINKINYTVRRSSERNMGIDVSLSSAWPFGGPNVTDKMAARYSSGGKLFKTEGSEKITKEIYNPEKQNLEAIGAFSDKGGYLDLNKYVSPKGLLEYTFPIGNWDIYALFSAPTGQLTKRSGKGGEGLVLDHFDKSSVQEYLKRYDSLFIQKSYIRSTFNDSYEVYGADYTPHFLDEFSKRRGYKLEENLNNLFSVEKSDAYHRILHDYRETISDLLLESFVEVWANWAGKHGVKTVEQAHGSPGNILDLYAASDIPQTESFGASLLGIPGVRIDSLYNGKSSGRPDKLVMKFASSASNLEGKKLTSSESTTWLGNHFMVSLSQAKPQIDEHFLSGINHIMLTHSVYSPDSIAFPGWRFYAGANFGPTSAFADYMPDFSRYISRCQKLLQNSKPDNEVLLYIPVHDIWTEFEEGRSKLITFSVHNPQNWLYKNNFGEIASNLRFAGYDFDYISDRQVLKLNISNRQIITSGGTLYKTIVVPNCKRMPVETLSKFRDLAKAGINIVFTNNMPADVPGLYNIESRRLKLSQITNEMQKIKSVHELLDLTSFQNLSGLDLKKEAFEENHLNYIRKKNEKGVFYFVANQSNMFHEGWVALGVDFKSALIYDPETGAKGVANTNANKIYLQLEPGKSCFIELYDEGTVKSWAYSQETLSCPIDGKWDISFIKGGPVLPALYRSNGVVNWVTAPDTMARYFSGVGHYETVFDIPAEMINRSQYKLTLGDVREAADIWINDVFAGRAWCVPFEINIDPKLIKAKGNKLRVEVRNLDANRIIWMDRNKVSWQKFFFVDIAYKNFNTAGWKPVPSGLIGPVKLLSSKK